MAHAWCTSTPHYEHAHVPAAWSPIEQQVWHREMRCALYACHACAGRIHVLPGTNWQSHWSTEHKGSRQWLLPVDPTQFCDSDYSDFTLRKVFFFFPLIFHRAALNRIGFKFCPAEGCDGRCNSDGMNNKGPRKVWDLTDGIYYVFCNRFECKKCGVKFDAYFKYF